MRVAFITWRDLAHPQAGGSELVVDRLACGLVDRGHEVALLCGGPVSGDRSYRVVDLGGTFAQYLRAPFSGHRFRDWDLLVDVENGIPYFSPLWRRGPSVCLVHHIHTDQWAMRFPGPVAALGRVLEERVMPLAYRHRLFVAVSPSTAEALEGLGVPRGRIRPIRWGIDQRRTPPEREEPEPQFLALGRLVAHKQVDLMLRAWAEVRPVVGGRLVIAGDGPERDALEAKAPPGTTFLGRVGDAEKEHLLASSWFLVHTAAHEGWGVVVMEAAAAGRPTLALDAPGIRDAVVHGETGVLAADVHHLAAEWVSLARDRDRRIRLGVAAGRRSVDFTWERSVDDLLAVAAEAVGAPPDLEPAPSPPRQRAAA